MEIVSKTQNEFQKHADQTKKFPQIQKCSFSGSAADFYIGLSGVKGGKSVRIVGAVCKEMVETGINKLLGQGLDEFKWPVVLDLKKKVLFHSHDAHQQGTSAILGWKAFLSES